MGRRCQVQEGLLNFTGDVRRGSGHFLAGLSLIMVRDVGVVKELTFKNSDLLNCAEYV